MNGTARLANGLDMYYEESGRGDPLILHYGTGGDHGAWQPQVEGLADSFRIITPDPRGTGRTPGAGSEWSMALLAADLVAFMDALGLARAHIGGMSMGAAVCQEVAIRYPERVSSVILSNAWGRTDARLRMLWEHSLFLTRQMARSGQDERERWQALLYDHGIATFFSSDALENRRDLVARWWERYSSGLREDTGDGHWRAMLAHDVLDRLPSVTAPALVLAGEEDYFTPYYPRQVHERLPDSTFVLLEGPGSSHGLLWERSDEANALIRQFLTHRRARADRADA
jgi:pimeloyl-ACP methyl ester carboxylesterase